MPLRYTGNYLASICCSLDLADGFGLPGPSKRRNGHFVTRGSAGGWKRFLSGTILVRDSKAGVGTELTVVQKYGKQDSGTTEHLPSPQGK
jgi:hypothetical protein